MATVRVISSGIRGPRGPQGSNGTADNRGGFSLNYSGSVVLNASWSAGNPQKVASTNASHVTASGYNEWHFSDIPRSFTGQYISATEEDIFSILTGSIVSSGQALVRVWDDEDPTYEAFYINSGSARITNTGNIDGGDLTMDLKWVGGRGFGTTTSQVWPNGTTPGNTNVSFELIGGLPGEKGDKGDQGDIGLTGPQGSDGPTGPEGPTGFQGVQGSAGSQGNQGANGIAGPQGNQGANGALGSPIEILDNGSSITTDVESINFVGATITEPTADNVTVTITGGGGGVGTLQQVTDLGNTTTNDVTVADITGSRAIFEDSKGNTIIGSNHGSPVNPVSQRNILLGSGSMKDGQTVIDNIMVGFSIGQNLQYGVNNVLLGAGVMQSSSGSNASDGNIAIGNGALQNANEVNHNITLGHNSGNYLKGDKNILIGYSSGGGGHTGTKNILIGDGANMYPTSGNYENSIIIGTYSTTYGTAYFDGGSNNVMIGNPGMERNTLWGELDISGSISSSAEITSREDIIAGRNSNFGVVITSPNNTKYRIVVDNSGNLSTTAV